MTLTMLTMEHAHDAAMDRDPTLPERPSHRTFSAEYKLKILDEYEAATEDGSKGAILRREGPYTSVDDVPGPEHHGRPGETLEPAAAREPADGGDMMSVASSRAISTPA